MTKTKKAQLAEGILKELLNHRTGKTELIKNYSTPSDDGRHGRTFEMAVRYFMTPSTKVWWSQQASRLDHKLYINGKQVSFEIKSGSGKLITSLPAELLHHASPMDLIPYVLEDVDYIVYTRSYTEGDNVGQTAIVATAEDFRSFLSNYSADTVKFNSYNGKHALSLRPFNSKRFINYFENWSSEQPTLEEWLKQNGK